MGVLETVQSHIKSFKKSYQVVPDNGLIPKRSMNTKNYKSAFQDLVALTNKGVNKNDFILRSVKEVSNMQLLGGYFGTLETPRD